MSNFIISQVSKEDKLNGFKNLIHWKTKLQIDLRSMRLVDYIEKEFDEGKIDLPLDRRLEQNAQALRYLHVTLFKQVSTLVMSEKSAFATYNKICALFESNRLAEITLVEERYHKLVFESGSNPLKFVNDFNKLTSELLELGMEFDD